MMWNLIKIYQKRKAEKEDRINRAVELQMKIYEAEDNFIDKFFILLEKATHEGAEKK